ncbi:MAG: ATP-binding cassette domain-containing protein [Thermodesulfobacteriota bacterium]
MSKGEATAAPETLRLNAAPLPASLLKELFARLRLPVSPGALNRACVQAQPEGAAQPPLQRLAAILKLLQLRGVRPALLRFARFDRRRLPALLFHQGEWHLLEWRNSCLSLTSATGQRREDCREEELQEGLVLWLNSPAAASGEVGSFAKDNPARAMVLRELLRSKRWLFDVVIATLVINTLAISTSVFAMQVYDRVVPTLAYATLKTLVAGMAIILCLDWLLKTVRARILDSVACAVDKAVSQQLYEHLLKLRLDQRPQSLGTMAAQVGGLDAVRQFFSSTVIFALVDMPFALMFITFIAIIGGLEVAFVYLALLPVAAALGLVSQLRLRRLLARQLVRSNERQGLLVDTIRGAESIRAASGAWRFAEEWQAITRTIARYNVKQKAVSNLTTVTTGSLSSLAYISAVVVGVGQIEAGSLTMGGLIACSILGGRVIAPIAQSVHYLVQWQNVSQSLRLVNHILLLPAERRDGQELLLPSARPETIELDQVTFSYANSPVRQLGIPKLSFAAGERVAILGPVGSGKSSLLKVLCGLYKPSEGRVRLGQADLWEVDPNIIAEQIGYLPQVIHLFKGSLRSNLTLSGAVGDSELLQICHELGIDRIAADNPRSMEMEISEGGEGLSGGQRQLVGLARTFLARPKIWLLDEPSASLDNETEARVFAALQRYVRPDDILLIATHKPMLVAKLVKRMVVMRQGEVVADGRPEAVIAKMKGSGPGRRLTGGQAIRPLLGDGQRRQGGVDVI